MSAVNSVGPTRAPPRRRRFGTELRDLVAEGWGGLSAHRLRSLLSATGILFGVAAVVGILAIGEGARAEQDRLIDQLGILNFFVKARETPTDPAVAAEQARLSPGLSRRDQAALGMLPGARHVGAMRLIETRDLVPRPEDPEKIRVVGADPAYLAASRLVRVAGRPLDAEDERRSAAVCLLGRGALAQLFPGKPGLGEKLRVGPVWLTVVGVVGEPGGGQREIEGVDLEDRSHDVIVPLSTALRRFSLPLSDAELSELVVSVAAVEEVPGATRVAMSAMSRLHRGAEDWELVVPLRLLEQSRAQQRIFNLVMGLIAGISLLVGGIGIMNIMLATVTERTREIGIRLAVGASPRDIQVLFLVESSMISLSGGFLGILAGLLLSRGIAAFTGWETVVGAGTLAFAALISMVEGVLFGFLPARRASALLPAEAVRQTG